MRTFKVKCLLPDFGTLPRVTLLVIAVLGWTLVSGFAYNPKNIVVATVPVGALPFSLVVSPDNSLVYVGNEGPNSISAINTATNQVSFTINLSGLPFYLAITPDGSKLHCIELDTNADFEFSTVTKKLIQNYATGPSPQQLAISPDGHLVYIPNAYNGTVTVISNDSLQSPIVVKGSPVAAIFSPDGKHAYITNQGSSPDFVYYVSVIDTTNNTVSAVIDPSAMPYPAGGLAISPDGATLYLAGENTNFEPVVAFIDIATNQITHTILLKQRSFFDPGIPALTPDGLFLYVPVLTGRSRPADNAVKVINTATKEKIGRVVVGKEPVAVAIAPDGNYAYVSNYLDATVSVIDISPQ